jgi:glycerophosphoryl diester phosphodiesterase
MSARTESAALKLLMIDRPLLIGHRGYASLAPENTLPSFELALKAGPDLVELDYRHSRDGVPMVIHDPTLDRTTDARRKWGGSRIRVAGWSAAEIRTLDAGSWFGAEFAGAKVPLLTEALEFIVQRGGVPLIEHKSGDPTTCIRLLRRLGLIDRVVVISFDWSYLREFHRREPRQLLGALGVPTRLADGRRAFRLSRRLSGRWLERLAETGARVAVWNPQVSKAAVESAHERGLKVWVYTVDNPRNAKRLLARGVDGLITNRVELIQRRVQQR